MFQECQLNKRMAHAIITSEKDVLDGRCNNDRILDYPVKVNAGTVHVAHSYLQMRVLINRCLKICGISLFEVRKLGFGTDFIGKLPHFSYSFIIQVPIMFDGVRLHSVLDEHEHECANPFEITALQQVFKSQFPRKEF